MNNFDYNRAIFSSDLSTNAKVTALAIGVHYNWKTKEASYPSIKTLTRETGLSRASIHRAKNELVSRGFIVSERRFNNSNLYLPEIPASLTLRDTQSHTEELKDTLKDNLKDNNNTKSSEDSLVTSVIINLNQEEVTNTSFESIWKVFENDERKPRPAVAAGFSNRKPRIGNSQPRRDYINNARQSETDQVLDSAKEW